MASVFGENEQVYSPYLKATLKLHPSTQLTQGFTESLTLTHLVQWAQLASAFSGPFCTNFPWEFPLGMPPLVLLSSSYNNECQLQPFSHPSAPQLSLSMANCR